MILLINGWQSAETLICKYDKNGIVGKIDCSGINNYVYEGILILSRHLTYDKLL